MEVPNVFVWRVSLFAAVGTLLAGYYDGTMNGILEMQGFKNVMIAPETEVPAGNMTDMVDRNQSCSSENGASSAILIGFMVAISNLGSAGGSLLAGWLSDQFSRKYGILISGVVLTIGSVILSASYHIWTFVIGRAIGGVGVGIIYMVVPVYISETSPKEWRGMLTSLIGPGYTIGLLVALSTNVAFSLFIVGWRVAYVVLSVSSLLYALGMKWMTHTPGWLIMKSREKEALMVLTKISHNGFVESCLELKELKEASSQNSDCWGTFKKLLRWKYLSRLILVMALFFILSSTGNFLYFYTTTLFCGVNVPPLFASLSVGLIGFISTMVLPFFIDKIGRKASLLCGSAVNMVLAFTVASLILVYGSDYVVAWIVVVIICVYAFSTNCTWLTIPFIVNSEIFPVNIRGLAVALATASYWIFTFLINEITPYILGSTLRFFYIVAGISFLSVFLVLFTLPETKGVSLEHMDELFSQRCLKVNCFRCANKHESCELNKDNHKDVRTIDEIKSVDEEIV